MSDLSIPPPSARGLAFTGLASGLLFGFGLALSGMTRTERVRGFLDFAGAWDPTLLFVMGGAVTVNALVWRAIARRGAPLLDARFHLTTLREIDARLLVGSAVFGVGWGVGGFCPGPAVVSIVTGAPAALAFVAAMFLGFALTDRLVPSPP